LKDEQAITFSLRRKTKS